MTDAEKTETNDGDAPLNQDSKAFDADALEAAIDPVLDPAVDPVIDIDAEGDELTEDALDLDERDVLIDKLIAETADLKDQVLRTAAELENTRRRAIREKEDAQKYAAANFARDILSVADNMRRAIDALPEDQRDGLSEAVKTLIVGVEMTERELIAVFERNGIKQVDAIGQKFDPNQHNALFEVEDASVPAGTVVQQIASGFMMGERLLRPAQVGVSKGGPKAAAEAETAPSSGDEA